MSTPDVNPHAPIDSTETPDLLLRNRGRKFILFAYLVPPIPLAFANIVNAISMRRTPHTGPTVMDGVSLYGTLGILILCLFLCIWGSWYLKRSLPISFVAILAFVVELFVVGRLLIWVAEAIMGIGF